MKYLCLILFCFSLNTFAANWLVFSSDNESTTFVDTDSIIADKNQNSVLSFQFWTKREYLKPRPLDKADKRQFDTLLLLFKIYCKDRKYELMSTTARIGSKIVYMQEDMQAMGNIAPETQFEGYYNMACKPPNQ